MYWLPNAIAITPPATTGWQTVDLTAQSVPANAVCIIKFFPTLATVVAGARQVTSGDSRAVAVPMLTSNILCGVNASSQLQLYRNAVSCRYYLLGWFTSSEAVYFLNGINKTPASTGWQEIDCSANVPVGTKFAIIEFSYGGTVGVNFRKNGSGDLRQPSNSPGQAWYVVGLDINRKCQIYIETATTNKVYLVGYINYGISKETGLDKSLSITGFYQDINLSTDAPSDAIAAIIEVKGTSAESFGLRKNGGSDDWYIANYVDASHFDIVELDAGKIIEGKINNVNLDFFVHGYITPSAPTAEFSGTPLSGSVPLSVIFTDLSTDYPTYWEWNFGDGSSLNYTQNPTHIYNNAGTYTVSLTVSNAVGYDSEVKSNYITVINVGTASLIFPALTGLAESWGMELNIPMFQIGAGGYWTDFTQMTLTMLQLQASGYVISNDGLATFPVLTISASGNVGIIGSAELILPAFGLSAGQPPLAGANIILPLFEVNASGSVMQTGSAILTLPPLTLSGTGLTGLYGNASLVLPPFSNYGIGLVSLNITGDALLILPSLKLDATGNIVYAETFQVFAINTKNLAISNYINYSYNSFAKFGDLYLASSSNGIYLLEGTKDETSNINTKFSTGLLGMGVDKLKRVIDMILGIKSNGKYDLKVVTDDGIEATYELIDASNVPHPVRRKLDKGRKGKYWKLKIYNKEGSDFEIDSIQSTVDTMSRRV